MDRQDLQDGFGPPYFILSILFIHVKPLLSFLRLSYHNACPLTNQNQANIEQSTLNIQR